MTRGIFERAATVGTVAGFSFFGLAFVSLGLIPWILTDRAAPVRRAAEFEARFLPKAVPPELRGVYKDLNEYKEALVKGRNVYIAEGCWHCHTQYVRPTGNEAARYGPVSENWEYQNEMNLPQLFGTRRVGPDLIREHDVHNLDWQLAHLRDPRSLVPESVMPKYSWLFGADGAPNVKGWALAAYILWLGSWRAGTPEGTEG
jgi:hypothetical protein